MGDSLPVAPDWFEVVELGDGLTRVRERHVDPLLRANIWHVRGRDRDLVVDAGLGFTALTTALPWLIERAPILLVTHGHLDHLGGAAEFPEVWMHADEPAPRSAPPSLFGDGLAAHLGTDDLELPDLLVSALPDADARVEDYTYAMPEVAQRAEEGDVIDLGDRCLTVLHLPGHTPGSIGLLDDHIGALFTGDAIYDDEPLDSLPESDVTTYVETMRRLATMDIGVVHAGHDDSFGRGRLREIASDYVQRHGGEAPRHLTPG